MAKETKETSKDVDKEVVKSEVTEASTSSAKPRADWAIEHSSSHHYTDMAKISAGLFVGVLALMVFLLSVGLQHPKPMIRSFLYVAFVALGLSLLFYQLGVIMEARAAVKARALDTSDVEAAGKSRRALGTVRFIQQLIFAISIIATVGFAIAASQLFFVSAAAQTQSSTTGQ